MGKKDRSLSYFEPHMEFDGVKVQDAVVEKDEDDCIRVLLENHGFSPVVVEEGQILGSMEEVRLCQEECLVDEAVVSAISSTVCRKAKGILLGGCFMGGLSPACINVMSDQIG